jgi:hypothetical protein
MAPADEDDSLVFVEYVEHCPNLLPYVDYLLEGPEGCVGDLKRWMNKALKLTLSEGERS